MRMKECTYHIIRSRDIQGQLIDSVPQGYVIRVRADARHDVDDVYHVACTRVTHGSTLTWSSSPTEQLARSSWHCVKYTFTFMRSRVSERQGSGAQASCCTITFPASNLSAGIHQPVSHADLRHTWPINVVEHPFTCSAGFLHTFAGE